jgi:ribosomal protein S18 acetylase RimI-like enzyme
MHSSSSVLIRSAVPEDLTALVSLGLSIQELHADGRPDLFAAPDESALRQFFESRLVDGSHLVLAVEGETPVGYVLAEHMLRPANPFRPALSFFYIHHIAVGPGSQGNGVGIALMDWASETATTLGVSALRLDSWHFNADAHGFFRSQGFTPVNLVFEKPSPVS